MIDSVAATGLIDQSGSIKDLDLTSVIVNQASSFEFSSGGGDPNSPDAKHQGDELMGHEKSA